MTAWALGALGFILLKRYTFCLFVIFCFYFYFFMSIILGKIGKNILQEKHDDILVFKDPFS
jgi:hypothetical protein